MLRRRVIPCLDVANGRVVKGTRFVDLVDEGDPPELAERYARKAPTSSCSSTSPPRPRVAGRCWTSWSARRVARSCRSPSAAASAASTTCARSSGPGRTRSASTPRAVADPRARDARARPGSGRQAVVVAIDARRIDGATPTLPVRVRGRRQGRPRAGRPRRGRLGGARRRARRGRAARHLDRPRRHEVGLRHRAAARRSRARVRVPVIASGGASGAARLRRGGPRRRRRCRPRRLDLPSPRGVDRRVKAEMAAAGIPVRLTTGTEVPA